MIIKSQVDSSVYRVIVLENKLKVLLISNPEYTKSSSCLTVRVGSFDEPNEYPGLAHFLEHMLFMGTKKYPDENGFDDFLSHHSGSSNAYTDSEVTVYYFDVDSLHFTEASDRFAQFFTSPLLSKDSVDREILAVNSEFLNSLTNRGWRQQALLNNLVLKDRPEYRFTCGNKETLQKEDILEAVRTFEKDFYSSDLMTLVVCGREGLNELLKIAELFKDIKNKSRKEEVDQKLIKKYDLYDKKYDLYDKKSNSSNQEIINIEYLIKLKKIENEYLIDQNLNDKKEEYLINQNLNDKKEEYLINQKIIKKQDLIDQKIIKKQDLSNQELMKNETKLNIFRDEFYSKIIQYAPLDDKKELVIRVALPRLREHFNKNPLEYFNFLLISKEPTGVVANIKRRKLGFDLSFEYEHSSEYTSVAISIELTDFGAKDYKTILDMLVAYISSMPICPVEYSRLRRIREEEFTFLQSKSPVDTACTICANLPFYPEENLLNYPYVFNDFDEDLLLSIRTRLADVTRWIVLLADKNGTFDCKEEIYSVEHTILSAYESPKNTSLFTSFKNPSVFSSGNSSVVSSGNSSVFSSNNSNVFSSGNSSVFSSGNSNVFLEDIKILEALPTRTYKSLKLPNGEIHQVFDCKFKVPKSEIFIKLQGKEITENPVATQIFFGLANDFFSEQFARQMCNYHLDIFVDASSTGVKIRFEGFSAKIFEMALKFFDILPEIPLDKFEVIRKEIEDFYSESINTSPYIRTMEVFRSNFHSSKTSEELLEEVKRIKMEDIKAPNGFYLNILAVGNLDWKDVESFYKAVERPGLYNVKSDFNQNITSQPVKIGEHETRSTSQPVKIAEHETRSTSQPVDLISSQPVKIHVKQCNSKDIVNFAVQSPRIIEDLTFDTIDKFNNALAMLFNFNKMTALSAPAICYEFDGSTETVDPAILSFSLDSRPYYFNYAIGQLICQISQEAFFNQLRTVEQLGYIVSCSVKAFSSAHFLVFTVQSEKPVTFLENRILQFIDFIKDLIKNMEEDDFTSHKESLACTFEEPVLNLEDLFGISYSQIHTGSIDVNLGVKMASVIMSLTQQDLLKMDIFKEYTKVSSIRKD